MAPDTFPPPEPLSPELALVHPELAERARELLPDRPWELFAVSTRRDAELETIPSQSEANAPHEPPDAPRTSSQAVLLPPPAVSRERPAESRGQSAPKAGPVAVPPHPEVEPVPHALRGPATLPARTRAERPASAGSSAPDARRRVTLGRLVGALAATLAAGVLVAGTLPLVLSGPELAAAPLASSDPIAERGGGYTAGEILTFMTDGEGMALVNLTSISHCGTVTAPGPFEVATDGSFALAFGTTPDVEVRGRFVSSRRAEGTIRVRGTGCDTGRTRFLAFLS